MRRALALVVVLAVPVSMSAQWFRIRTPGVPRLPSGAPNLKAPAPRSADGHPDLSGIWIADNPLPCPPLLRDGNDCLEKMPLSKEAYNIAASLAAGLPYQPWAAAVAKQRTAENAKDDPHVRCLPSNPPRNWALPHYQKILQIPGLVALLSEFNARPVDPQPSWTGYSVGRWIGDALVVETTGLRDDLWLDMNGNPMTSAATIFERISRPDFGSLEIAFTVDDPRAYTKPWTVVLKQSIVVDSELVDEVCLENEKSLPHLVGK
jgi:hypothetical protein